LSRCSALQTPPAPLLVACRVVAGLLVLWCVAGRSLPVAAQSLIQGSLTPRAMVATSHEPWTVEADKISYDQEKKLYEAEGNVRVRSGDRSIQADRAKLDAQKQEVELEGKALLRFGRNWLEGEHIFWNLDSETGWVDGGLVYFADTRFYVEGRSIAKTGASTYELHEGFLTSCNPADADWKIKYDKLKVEVGGYAWATKTSFWARRLPLLYTPAMVLPVKQERQSGVLLPWLGTSTLNGTEGEIPFFWAIREDMDMTFYGRMMQKRGWMSGLEYRLNHERFGEGVLLFNYLNDSADADFQQERGYPLETRNRYWLRSRYNFDLPHLIHGKLDLDMLSDSNYLKEFVNGSTSVGASERIFQNRFGRGVLNDKTVSYRESTLYLERPFESAVLSLDTRYWDQTNRNLQNLSLQRLPSLSFTAIPTWIDRLPLYYTMQSSWTDYWRSEGTTGNRLDLFPRLAYPFHWKSYLDVETSAGLRSTSYWVDWREESRDPSPWQGRLLSDVRVDLSSRLNRVYPFEMGPYQAVQHALRPEVIYEYVPEVSQTNLPSFDKLDRDQARHDLLFGFSTFLTTKEVRMDAENQPVTSYREITRLRILQQYNIEQPPLDEQFNPYPESGFADLLFRLDVMPKRYLGLTYNAILLPDEGQAKQHDFFMSLDSGQGHLLRLGYQYRNDFPIDEVIAELGLKVLPGITLSTYHDYSLRNQELYSQGYGLRYVRGCWGIGLVYEREAGDNRFLVSINLLGLGSIGAGQTMGSLGGAGRTW